MASRLFKSSTLLLPYDQASSLILQRLRARKVSFQSIGIHKRIIKKLEDNGIVDCTEIQKKSLQRVLAEKNVIINSETGSGKTLCYVLPILQKIIKGKPFLNDSKAPNLRALILAPNAELVHQISSVFRTYGEGFANVGMAYGGSPLIIQQNTQVLVTAPSFLINYKLDLFKGIQTLVFDEADMLTSTQQRQMIHLLNYFSNPAEDNTLPNKLKRRIRNNAKFQKDKPETPPQFLFVGATIPSIARGSPFSFIQTYVPDVKHIQTDSTHRTVETLETEFIECSEEEKLTNLVKVMNSETRKLLQRPGSGDADSPDLTHATGTRTFKVLIFVNNVDKADEVFGFLCNNQMGQEVVNDAAGIEQFSTTYIDSKLTVGKLHGYIPIKERLELLEKFRNGTCNVLVTTDVSSRGLDLPNVTLIVQYDFAANITDVLHRVGRTARAGLNGKVISFVTDKDKDLSNAFQSTLDKNEDISQLFSRRRSFRKKVKRGHIAV